MTRKERRIGYADGLLLSVSGFSQKNLPLKGQARVLLGYTDGTHLRRSGRCRRRLRFQSPEFIQSPEGAAHTDRPDSSDPVQHQLRPVLRFMQASVDPGGRQQFVMAALLGHAGLVHDDDPVGVLNRRQAMRDYQRRAAHGEIG
jgi:hypothetical protein